MELKVGELAKRAGLTVRTLHHYDEIDLLSPSARTASGHRIYGTEDVERLHRISSLRQLGLGLADIADCLDGEDAAGAALIARQVAFLKQRIKAEEQLVRRLEAILASVDQGQPASTDRLLEAIEMVNAIERAYSDEQRTRLEHRAEKLGAPALESAQRAWAEIFEALESARLQGVAPANDEVQAWVRKAHELVQAFTGGDQGIRQSLDNSVEQDRPMMYRAWGIDESLGEYYQAAMAVLMASSPSTEPPRRSPL